MMKKIAFVLYTSGLEYDDRIRKEAKSLSKYANVEIFVITPKNFKEIGVTEYGSKFQSFSLITRKLLPSGKFTFLKSFEFYLRVKNYLNKFDVVWVHDVESSLIPFLLNHKKIIWDLHEIPTPFIKNRITKSLFKLIENRCKLIIHANPNRIEYLKDINLIKSKNKHFVLRNYPDETFLNSSKKDKKFNDFIKWVGENEYIYLQGLQNTSRFPEETIDAVINYGKFKAIVIGDFDNNIKIKLEDKYGDRLRDIIYFRGKVSQYEIKPYIQLSKFSLIFYSSNTPNNKYCEPNRMYQSIILDKPVVVGKNIPMRNIVTQYNCGVVLESYGNNSDDIQKAISALLNNYNNFKKSIDINKHNILWSAQNNTINKIIDVLDLQNSKQYS